LPYGTGSYVKTYPCMPKARTICVLYKYIKKTCLSNIKQYVIYLRVNQQHEIAKFEIVTDIS